MTWGSEQSTVGQRRSSNFLKSEFAAATDPLAGSTLFSGRLAIGTKSGTGFEPRGLKSKTDTTLRAKAVNNAISELFRGSTKSDSIVPCLLGKGVQSHESPPIGGSEVAAATA